MLDICHLKFGLKSDYKILTRNVKPNIEHSQKAKAKLEIWTWTLPIIERSQKGNLMNVHRKGNLPLPLKPKTDWIDGLIEMDWIQQINRILNRIESTESDRMPWIGPKQIEIWIGLNASNRTETDWIGLNRTECIESDRNGLRQNLHFWKFWS